MVRPPKGGPPPAESLQAGPLLALCAKCSGVWPDKETLFEGPGNYRAILLIVGAKTVKR